MSLSTYDLHYEGDTIIVGLAIPSSYTPPTTCFGPTYTLTSRSNTLITSSGSYILDVVLNSDCSPPGADDLGNSTIPTPGEYTSTKSWFYGTCPPDYVTADGARGIITGSVASVAICCPSGQSMSYNRAVPDGNLFTMLLTYGPRQICSRRANVPITAIYGSSTRILGTENIVSILEQPIVALVANPISPLPGITFTSFSVTTSSVGNRAYRTYTYLNVIPESMGEFKLPPSCLSPTYTIGTDGYDLYYSSIYDAANPQAPPEPLLTRGHPSCYPEGFYLGNVVRTPTTMASEVTLTSYADFFFPGTCPPGFSMIKSSSWTQSGGDSYTAFVGGLCCPNGWSIPGQDGSQVAQCASKPTASVTVIDVHTTMTLDSASVVAMLYKPIGVASTSKVIGFGDAACPGQTAAMAAQTGAASASMSCDTPASHDLSRGATAGIAVGVVLAVLLTALVAFLFWRRRKSKRAAAVPHDCDEEKGRETYATSKAELPGGGHESVLFEAPEKTKPAEVDHMNVRAELEGDAAWEAPATEAKDRPSNKDDNNGFATDTVRPDVFDEDRVKDQEPILVSSRPTNEAHT